MRFEELVILLPCHSFEDFPLYHTGDDAEGLLAAYTALWHPAFLASAEKLPIWARADSPPDDVKNRLIVVPTTSDSQLLTGWPARAKSEGACVVRKKIKRAEILSAALAEFEGPEKDVSAEAVADFMALAYTYLQSELLIRQLRQYSNLDEIHLRNEVVAGAKAACSGDLVEAKRRLQSAFDLLQESRERAYPAEAYLLDLTLTADTTLGPELAAELAAGGPTNLLVSASLLPKLAELHPAAFERLKSLVADGEADVLGGEWDERDLPLLGADSLLYGLQLGLKAYEDRLGKPAAAFARRRYGLTPLLPGVLSKLGVPAAVHFTLDDGQFPAAPQSRIRWEGLDGGTIDALAKVPLEADLPATFLGLAEKAAATMDSDQAATLVFAHWPGRSSEYYEDLRRGARFSPVLGKFVTLTEYLKLSSAPGDNAHFRCDEYRSPYMKQAIIRRRPAPVGSSADYFKRRAAWDAGAALHCWARMFGATPAEGSVPAESALAASQGELLAEIERSTSASQEPAAADLDARVEAFRAAAAAALAPRLGTSSTVPKPGALVFNSLSSARRAYVLLPGWKERPALEGAVRAAQIRPDGVLVAVDLPAMGYAWIPRPKVSAPEKKLPKPLADDPFVRNEFFEAAVDRKTGAVRTVHDYVHRAARLSQQISLRLPGRKPKAGDVWKDPDEEAVYATMAADRVDVTSIGPVLGETVSRGRLLDPEGKVVARFVQTTQAWIGSRVLGIEIELEVVEPPKADPWNSYFCCRLAWNDETAEMFGSAGGVRTKTTAKRIESPYFVEAVAPNAKTLVLTDGLPFHRKIGFRMLDVLLAVKGDGRTKFRLGVGLDVEQPFAAALQHLSPPILVPDVAGPPSAGESSWFFHLDRKSVQVVSWTPLMEGGTNRGVQLRLLNTESRKSELKIRSLYEPKSARMTDFRGRTLQSLKVEKDSVACDLQPHELVQIELEW